MSDDISGIFNHLTPDDFDRSTSAIHQTDDHLTNEFDQFVDRQLDSIRMAFAAADGRINPVGVLASPTTERVFTPDDDETLGQYIDRLGREARVIGAQRMFFCQITKVAMHDGDEAHDVEDVSMLNGLTEALTSALYWYSETLQADSSTRRHGILTIVGNSLGELHEGTPDQQSPLLASILGATLA